MNKKQLLLLVLFLIQGCSSKRDFNQYLADQDKDKKFIQESMKNFENKSEFVTGQERVKKHDSEVDKDSKNLGNHYMIDRSSEAGLLKPSHKRFNQYPSGTLKGQNNYIVHSNSKSAYNLRNSGNYSFGFVYFKDSYSYEDPTSNFVRTYENSDDSIKGGFLQFQFEKFLSRKYVDVVIGANVGIGYNNGKGIFLDGSQTVSNTKFTLWTLPIDLSLGIDFPLTSWIKISAYGGPSAMGLIQNRDDRDAQDDDKTKRQVSYGYFYGAKFRFSLTNIFKKTALKLYDQYEITRYFITIDSRIHQYENFQDTLSISGASVGVGFTFEYL